MNLSRTMRPLMLALCVSVFGACAGAQSQPGRQGYEPRVGQQAPVAHQQQAGPMQHHHALLLRGLHGNKAHGRPAHRLADRLGIGGVVLLPLDVGLHVGRRHQPHGRARALGQGRLRRRRQGLARGAGASRTARPGRRLPQPRRRRRLPHRRGHQGADPALRARRDQALRDRAPARRAARDDY